MAEKKFCLLVISNSFGAKLKNTSENYKPLMYDGFEFLIFFHFVHAEVGNYEEEKAPGWSLSLFLINKNQIKHRS